MTNWWQKLRLDPFLVIMITVVILASLFPATGSVATGFRYLTTAAIALLFFFHGAKLSREAIVTGMGHWRLHLMVFSSTFILFPLLGLGLQFLVPEWMSPAIYMGFLYLCALPATVQSAIAFTSVAGGNVAAAICSASASSILGVFLSPVIIGFMMETQGAHELDTLGAIRSILLQLMLPFVVGHLSRPLIGKWVDRNKKIINKTDRTSILLVVYVAFSEAVAEGIWQKIDAMSILQIAVVSCGLLAIVLLINVYGARALGFNKADEITIVFCGSKKSLANGVPMANVMFPPAVVGILVLPLMLFHQIQLMVCAVMAARYARQGKEHSQE